MLAISTGHRWISEERRKSFDIREPREKLPPKLRQVLEFEMNAFQVSYTLCFVLPN